MRFLGNMKIRDNSLYIGGVSTVAIAEKYGTPTFVVDEGFLRDNCAKFRENFQVEKMANKVIYAGKAFLTIAMCQLINEEGLCLDVVSGGELYTAYKADFPMDKIYFHGNNKTIDEISMAIELNVGTFVVDNFYEIEKINEIAGRKGKLQRVLLRVTPGIEAHTHEYIKTGKLDSKFGVTILGNKTIHAVKKILALPNIKLAGLHCHIGSQIFDITPYLDEVDIMLSIIKDIREETGRELEEVNLGGGFGIYYTEGDNPPDISEFCRAIINRALDACERLEIKLPTLCIEPGRSIVGNAGISLYTVGAIKSIPKIKKYISVDGGMTDNIRPALYSAEYECVIANRVESTWKEEVSVAGKCCESGDILLKGVVLPESYPGDLLAVLSTGAYGYSMSSNYNKIPRAAVVFVRDGECKVVCRRETYEDVISRERCI